MELLDAVNVLKPNDNLVSAGQPSEADFGKIADAGFSTVVNLRPESEAIDFDEPELVESLGLNYVNIPVKGPRDVTQANAAKLHQVLSEAPGKVLVHCASGNRVGALYALKCRFNDGASPLEALEQGKEAGLTALEQYVSQLLVAASNE